MVLGEIIQNTKVVIFCDRPWLYAAEKWAKKRPLEAALLNKLNSYAFLSRRTRSTMTGAATKMDE
jgi:hypothetical protein